MLGRHYIAVAGEISGHSTQTQLNSLLTADPLSSFYKLPDIKQTPFGVYAFYKSEYERNRKHALPDSPPKAAQMRWAKKLLDTYGKDKTVRLVAYYSKKWTIRSLYDVYQQSAGILYKLPNI
jgi:hypothetical protein